MPVKNAASEQGKGVMGCLFSLALMAAFAYAAFQIIPLYYHYNEFHSATEREVDRVAAKYIADGILRKNIMNFAAINQVPLEEKNIQINRIAGKLVVDVKYQVPVHFPFYAHVFRFEFRVASFMGAL